MAGLTDYKDFLGTNLSKMARELHERGRADYENAQAYMADPLGVGSLLLTSDDQIVLLKRSMSCAEAPGLYDIPGGHPEPQEIMGKVSIRNADYSLFTEDVIREEVFSSILREIHDEVNLPAVSLDQPLLLGVAINTLSGGRPSSEFIIRCGMLKRKLKANIEQALVAKRKSEEEKLDILFSFSGTVRPTSVAECLHYIRGLVDWRKFLDRFPPVVLKSQIYALFTDHTLIDSQVNQLRFQGKIIFIKLDLGTYGIVDKEQYLQTVRKQIDDDELSKCVGDDFIDFCIKDELNVEITSKQLHSCLGAHVTELVRAGYLTSEVTGVYYLSIPHASLFLRAFNDGLAFIRSLIRKAKFKEILLSGLLEKESRKTDKFGMTYYCLALIGSEEVKTVATTSGPLLRYIAES
ncbi:inactive serine/threonine-protein kinase 19-like isoform X1 [Watersipora subatra]|uniref:inactive serine/threonine-protein kinase 19-like isoform X1 n=1 Tax=Watersipora subatra TaxID=2589382 RepID=UPI00355BC828